MFITYGIHKREWNKYKKLVQIKGYDNLELKKRFDLDDRQNWFLFTKLLRGEYDHLYLRAKMRDEDIKLNQYVYNDELGNGVITNITEDKDMMFVKFDKKDLPVMCSTKGYTIYDDKRRKITKR